MLIFACPALMDLVVFLVYFAVFYTGANRPDRPGMRLDRRHLQRLTWPPVWRSAGC